MERTASILLAVSMVLVGAASPAEAGEEARSVSWATVGDAFALGVPGDDAATADFGSPLAFSGFSDRILHDGLDAALLAAGVSAAQLDEADFIAFDLNGITGGLEGASWSFDDGQGGTLTTSHSFGGIGTGILFNGDLAAVDYEALFVAPPPSAPFVGFVLFDLSDQGVDPFAPGLTATVEGLDMEIVNAPDFPGLGVMHRGGAACGDGVIDLGESCDDGNTVPGDGCTELCEIEPGGICGDGLRGGLEQCDDGNTLAGDGCSELCESEGIAGVVCAAARVPGCFGAAKARVAIVEKKLGNEKWKAKLKGFDGPTAQGDFGDPETGSTRYDICLYGGFGQLVGELSVDRAGQTCGVKPCWKRMGDKGYSYKDKETNSAGVKKIRSAAGPIGKGKLQVQAGNKARKGQTALPTGMSAALQGAELATLQVLTDDAGCFDAVLGTVKKADGSKFEARTP